MRLLQLGNCFRDILYDGPRLFFTSKVLFLVRLRVSIQIFNRFETVSGSTAFAVNHLFEKPWI